MSQLHRRARGTAVVVAAFAAMAPAATLVSIVTLSNLAFFRPRLGANLYNYTPPLQPLFALIIECILFTVAFRALRTALDYAKSGHQL